jgi:hypothetical protein
VISLVHEDQLWCGDSTDAVLADYADGVGGDCEVAVEGTPKWRKVRIGTSGRLVLRARCAWLVSAPCAGVLRLAPARAQATAPATAAGTAGSASLGPPAGCRPRGGRQLLRAKFKLRAGRVGSVALKLPASGRKLLKRRGCIPVVARFDLKGTDGVQYGSSRTLLLVARGYKVKTR